MGSRVRSLLGGRRHGPPAAPIVDLPRPVLDDLEKADRLTVTRLAAERGPVFDAVMHGEPCTCIVGLSRSRRFLKEHAAGVRAYTLELRPMVPKGFLRSMTGDDHLHYRRAVVRAARRLDEAVDHAVVHHITHDAIGGLAAFGADATPAALLDAAGTIATTSLVALFFGGQPGEPAFERLVDGFHRLGPHGLVWSPGDAQRAAYGDLCADLRARLATPGAIPVDCVLGAIADDDPASIDDTMLGGLVYMVEMGRFDLQVFVRWILRYAAANTDALDLVATDPAAADSFVLEVLRSDQSERLVRRALHDLEFEGRSIPAGSLVRLCMWEAHHDGSVFPDPYRFDPTRFVGRVPGPDEFSPFGIDHHQCPFGGLSIRFGCAVVRSLATTFRPVGLHDDRPVRGVYHWEPSRRMRVTLERR